MCVILMGLGELSRYPLAHDGRTVKSTGEYAQRNSLDCLDVFLSLF